MDEIPRRATFREGLFFIGKILVYISPAAAFFAAKSGSTSTANSIILLFSVPFAMLILPLLFISNSIKYLRKHSSDDVYILWMLFFFVTYVGFFILLYLKSHGIDSLGPYDNYLSGQANTAFGALIHWYAVTSVDLMSEFVFLLGLLGAFSIPQVFAFIASGLFGCGKPPQYIFVFTKFCIYNSIKAIAVYAAFRFATYFANVYYAGDEFVSIFILIETTWFLMFAFAGLAIYTKVIEYSEAISKSSRFQLPSCLQRIFEFMTKYST